MVVITEFFGIKKEWLAEQVGEIHKLKMLYNTSFEVIDKFFPNLSNEDKAKIHIFLVTAIRDINLPIEFK